MDGMDTIIFAGLILYFGGRGLYKVALWVLIVGGSFIVGKKVWDLTVGNDGKMNISNVISAIKMAKEGKE